MVIFLGYNGIYHRYIIDIRICFTSRKNGKPVRISIAQGHTEVLNDVRGIARQGGALGSWKFPQDDINYVIRHMSYFP